MSEPRTVFQIIDSLKVSSGWKDTFKKIHTAYFHNYYQGKANNMHLWRDSQELLELSVVDRFKFFTSFNPFALILGPLYYLGKFMFTKGIILLAIWIALYMLGGYYQYALILVHIYCAIFANRDYFSAKVINSEKVKADPGFLDDFVSEEYCETVSRRLSFFYPFVVFSLIFCGLYVNYVYSVVSQDVSYNKMVEGQFDVCNDATSCNEVIKLSMHNIQNKKGALEVEYYRLGVAYYVLGFKDNALKAADRSNSIESKFVPSYILKGRIFDDKKMFQQAILSYQKALKLYPNGKFINYYIGRAYYRDGKFKEAYTYFNTALKAKPDNIDYMEALAYTEIQMANIDTVNKRAHYKSAKKRLVKIIKVLESKGDDDNAVIVKRKSLKAYVETNLKGY